MFLTQNKIFFVSATGLSVSTDSIKRSCLRKTSSKEKCHLHRSSSRKNKENGVKIRAIETCKSHSLETIKLSSASVLVNQQSEGIAKKEDATTEKKYNSLERNITVGPQDCTEIDVQTFHVTLTYKPRI